MRISAIIVTLDRPDQVQECLRSILAQERQPDEVLVIDDSQDDRTAEVVKGIGDERVTHHRNQSGNALTIARNIGVEMTSGDIIAFFDDDVRLSSDYLRHIEEFLELRPDVVGVQGYWGEGPGQGHRRWRGTVKSALQLAHTEDTRCRVLPAWKNTYAHRPKSPEPCQWLSGCNMVYRRPVFNDLRFDEKLLRGSYGEDVDFSYRVWKRYPKGLYMLPYALVRHESAPINRAPSATFYKIAHANTRYLRHKNLGRGVRTRVAATVNLIGELVTLSARALSRPVRADREAPRTLVNWARGRWFAFRHRTRLRQGDLTFLDPLLDY